MIGKNNINKGFTLIELLIVVAIIGILAAVGAAVIPNLLTGAKVKATTENHSRITSWMKVNFLQCSIGSDSLSYTSNASGGIEVTACHTNAAGHENEIIAHLKYENYNNPYNTAEEAAYASSSTTPPLGRTHIDCSVAPGDTCKVYTNTGDEVLSAFITKD